ncbi:hypothetical protein V2W45_1383706 [Cenococcum geophilum]
MGALYKIGEAKLKRIIKHIKEEVKDKETVKNAFNKRKYFKCKSCQRTYIRENNIHKRLEFSNK